MKKFLTFMLIVCILLSAVAVLSACDGDDWNNGNFKVVTSITPVYDWTTNVLGEHSSGFNMKNMLNNGSDMHSYQASVSDISKIVTCDLLIYVGGESDDWVEKALKQSKNDDMIVIKLLDVIDDVLDEAGGIEGEDHDDHDDDGAVDEHIWMSLKRAKIAVNAIADALKKLDETNASDYTQNAQDYCDKLDALDLQYQQAVSTAVNKTLVVADRFPFVYLFDDYGLDYYAAFSGCSATTDPSMSTIYALVAKVNELNAKVLIVTESDDGKVANKIKELSDSKDQQILTLNSMQSIAAKNITNEVNYLTIMQRNLEVLRVAIS